jgi:alcohol dehydrogenase
VLEFFQYMTKTRIVGGHAGILCELGPELEPFRAKMACVVTDKVVQNLDILSNLEKSLHSVGIEVKDVFADVPQDSDVEVVERVASRFAAARCELLIAIGGGSVIDTAKAVNILLAHGGKLRDYQGVQMLTEPLLPLIVVPTTVGTGSEVTKVAVVVDREDFRKLTFVDDRICPTIAVLDPLVTFSLPNRLVVSTAIDAFTHAIESYIDLEHAPFSDSLAIAAGRLIRENLPSALADADETWNEARNEARANLQIASTMAGNAFSHSMVGIVHALAHALGSVAGVPHGIANGLMLMEGIRCNAEVAGDRIAEFAFMSGFTNQTDQMNHTNPSLSVEAGNVTQNAIVRLEKFRNQVFTMANLSLELQSYGVESGHLPLLVERALEDGAMVYNPKVVEANEVLQMYVNRLGAESHESI